MFPVEDHTGIWYVIQGIYYAVTGIWPIIHYKSFEKVTGPKTDVWLVKMVGALTVNTGITLLLFPFTILAAGAALSYLCVDVIYATRGVIRRIYLADAVVQVLLLAVIVKDIYNVYG